MSDARGVMGVFQVETLNGDVWITEFVVSDEDGLPTALRPFYRMRLIASGDLDTQEFSAATDVMLPTHAVVNVIRCHDGYPFEVEVER